MTARKSTRFTDNMHALRCGFITAVINKAMSSYQRGRAEIIVTAPVGWAGSGAGRAQDALGRIVKAGAFFGRLSTLAPIRRKRAVIDEIWQHLLVIIEEWF